MKSKIVNCLLLPLLSLVCVVAFAQDYASHVDPFIGTDRSDAPTLWGQYGGTYPGAVAPWGMVQLTPETRTVWEKGYFHSDSIICYFTCTGHNSGYPQGSHGSVQVVFGAAPHIKRAEQARPGYYSVTFADNSQVEMTTTTRTGMFRYKPQSNRTAVTIADAGAFQLSGDTVFTERYSGIFVFSQSWTNSSIDGQTLILEFERYSGNELLVKAAFSMVDFDGSRKNMNSENRDWNFDRIREETYRAWNEELSVVTVKSDNKADMTKFYTALYHSFLVPYIVSDVDGRYRGADRQVHATDGSTVYGRFSPWDTFRSLHPLLCILKPQRQNDMILSMLNIYDQRGYLPYTPMTGYHSIPIIADSYLKGITGFDTQKAYRAMKKFLSGTEIPRPDTYRYINDGFLNDSIEESVSVTLDYAYNDWVLSVFAEKTGQTQDAAMFRQRSLNYRNMFDVQTAFMLPRNVSGFVRNPGEMGYKEANKWTATWFVPHNVQDLINLFGGDNHFATRLHEAMQYHVVFDNEPVLHYPYLFSYAGRHDLTCYWVNHIRENCYTVTPGGIPGNDDLGSMSSWFVFSAMGFFPVSPGRDQYVLATPLFEEIVIRQENNMNFKIITDPDIIGSSFSELKFNGQPYFNSYITHGRIVAGGSFSFSSSANANVIFHPPASLTVGKPEFQVKTARPSNRRVMPHQETYMRFTVVNTGETGVFPATVKRDDNIVGEKRVLVEKGATVTDSIAFRLYHRGKHRLNIEQLQMPVSVSRSARQQPALACNRFTADVVVVKKGEPVNVMMEFQNISERTVSQIVGLYENGVKASDLICNLSPGETVTITKSLTIDRLGFHTLSVLNKTLKVRVYEHPKESCVLKIDMNSSHENILWDVSGFENHGTVVGQAKWGDSEAGRALQIDANSYVSFPMSESLNITGATLTMSAWIYPTKSTRGYIDFFTKGDYIVFQTDGGQLSFFAGGWGRGKCSIALPDNWLNNWHHVAGVCTGQEIILYLNGKEQQRVPVEGNINPTEIPWNLGRNAEMPYTRRFEGMFGDVQIYKEALSEQDIEELYNKFKSK